MKNLIAIVGPTGVGKSRLALQTAEKFNGEIINADSRQVYRYMNIGTAKPLPEELAHVPHHLINIIDPDEDFSLAQFQKLARRAISGVFRRDRLPVLVGGTGQYAWAVLEGWQIPKVAPDLDLRRKLEKIAAEGGGEALYKQLVETDPVSAQKIDKNNIRRLIRALEVLSRANESSYKLRGKKEPGFMSLIIGLTASREELYRRVDARVDEMIERGFIEEVKELITMGYGLGLPAVSSVGYRQIGEYLNGAVSLEDEVKKIKTETHRVIRHQYAWFRLSDIRIRWFDVEKVSDKEILELVARFLKQN